MFARIAYTWRLMGASFEVLKKDKELLLFPRGLMGAAWSLATFLVVPVLVVERRARSMP